MEELEAVIRGALTEGLQGCQVQFDPYPGYGKLHGTIIWHGFGDLDQADRIHRVWDILRPKLNEDQRRSTGFLITVTPIELDAILDVAA
jgi:hypothetical protein